MPLAEPTLPPRPVAPVRHLRRLFAVNAAPRRWPIALKASLAVMFPMVLAILIGHPSWGLLGNLGAFAAIYGAATPGRFRIKLLVLVTTALVGGALCGAAAAPWPIAGIALTVVVGVVGAFLCSTLQIGPPGAFFPTLVAGSAGYLIAQGTSAVLLITWVSIGAAAAAVIAMSDLLVDPRGPERRAIEKAEQRIAQQAQLEVDDASDAARTARRHASHALHRAWTAFRDSGGAKDATAVAFEERLLNAHTDWSRHHVARVAVLAGIVNGHGEHALDAEDRALHEEAIFAEVREAPLGRPPAAYLLRDALRWPSPQLLIALHTGIAALLAATIAVVGHIGHPYWAVAFAVLMVHQGGTRSAQTLRSVHRTLGTLLGIGLFLLIESVNPQGWWLVLLIGALQFFIEELVPRHYGAAVVLITPVPLMIATVNAPQHAALFARDRMLDTLVASVCAILTVWLVGTARTSLALLRHQLIRDAEGISMVLRDQAAGDVTVEALERRRLLHYEIVTTTGLVTLSGGDAPDLVAPWRPVATSMRELGMMTLGMAWLPPSVDQASTTALNSARTKAQALVGALATNDLEASQAHVDACRTRLLSASAPTGPTDPEDLHNKKKEEAKKVGSPTSAR